MVVRVRVSVRRRRAATENLILVVGPFSFRGEPGRDVPSCCWLFCL